LPLTGCSRPEEEVKLLTLYDFSDRLHILWGGFYARLHGNWSLIMGRPEYPVPDYFTSLFAPTDSKVSGLMEALAKASVKPELPAPNSFSFASLFGSAEPNPSVLPGGIASLFGTASPAPAKPGGILFRRVDGEKVRFSEPMHFPWMLTPPSFPAVYAILVPDTAWTPLAYRPIYFGETGNAEARPTRSHEHYDDWCRVAGTAENLYVAYCWMFDST